MGSISDDKSVVLSEIGRIASTCSPAGAAALAASAADALLLMFPECGMTKREIMDAIFVRRFAIEKARNSAKAVVAKVAP